MDYETRLDRALAETPDFAGSESRLDVPEAVAQRDGAFTRLTNVDDIADALNRPTDHLYRSIQRELGTNAQMGEGVARFNGNFSADEFDAAVAAYVSEYVECSECGLPDTRLVTEDGTPMLRCEACGAFRPVSKGSSRSTSADSGPAVEAGETYHVKITGTGRKGDGVAEKGPFTIFVSGAQEGQELDIYVERTSGTLAFARPA
jgi:translation initiation factor 2 subunit 2